MINHTLSFDILVYSTMKSNATAIPSTSPTEESDRRSNFSLRESDRFSLLERQMKQVDQTLKEIRSNILHSSFPETYIEQYDELLQTKTLLLIEWNRLTQTKH